MILSATQSGLSQCLACNVFGLNRNTVRQTYKNYTFCGLKPLRRQKGIQPRALSKSERDAVHQVLISDEYADQPPVQAYQKLLQNSEYLCSVSTMHRILREQALMAAVAGAEFLAPYVNRLDNICSDGVNVAAEMVALIDIYDLDAKVLGASFKNVQQVHQLSLVGAHSVTISPDVFDQLLTHPLTDSGVAGFVADWEGVYGEGTNVLDVL